MTKGRTACRIELSAEDRAYLEQQVRRWKVSRALSERAQIVLLSASGLENKQIARKTGPRRHPPALLCPRLPSQLLCIHQSGYDNPCRHLLLLYLNCTSESHPCGFGNPLRVRIYEGWYK